MTMINIKNRGLIDFDRNIIMGILNATPDSFYSGSRVEKDNDAILKRAEKLISEGAEIIDIGGYSSRPGAAEVSEQEELDRVCNATEIVRSAFPEIIISIDTFRSKVAEVSVNSCGADIINDISAGEIDKEMLPTVAKLHVPYILMHSIGKSVAEQQESAKYDSFLDDIFKFFARKLDECRLLGISDVILDPGFGFSKTMEQNYQLLSHLGEFRNFEGCPLLVGVSRKRMAWQVAETTIEESLNATTALHALALSSGLPMILRVHDVKEAVETVKIVEMYNKTGL